MCVCGGVVHTVDEWMDAGYLEFIPDPSVSLNQPGLLLHLILSQKEKQRNNRVQDLAIVAQAGLSTGAV